MVVVTRRAFMAAMAALLPVGRGVAGTVTIPSPGPSDTCPVCGMFVAKYPEWVATLVFADGKAAHFDGAKCHFKFVLEMARFDAAHRREDIRAAAVTEYYDLGKVDTFSAIYVIGSDVLGPMGHELVPFASAADAEDFRKDHGGRLLASPAAIDWNLLTALDEGRF